MWPMGHVAVAYLCLIGYDRLRSTNLSIDGTTVLIVCFGALFPDLVDKPLAWYLGVLPTGRSLGHSLVVLVPLCLAVGMLAAQRDRIGWAVAFAIGVMSHVILDALPVLWDPTASADFLAYPIVRVEPYADESAPGVFELLLNSLTDPYFLIEFPLLAIALFAWYQRGLPGVGLIRTQIAARFT